MKRSLLALSLFSASVVYADSAFHPAGENLTYGASANTQSLISFTNNPATGASSLDNKETYSGFGFITSFGVGVEIGPVDDFIDQFDSLKTQLDDFSAKDIPSIDDVESIKNNFDTFLVEAGDVGRLQVNTALQVPLFPIVMGSQGGFGGSLVFDANIAALAQFRLLDSPIEYNPLEQGANILQTNSAVYLKFGAIGEASLGYSLPLVKFENGGIHAGVRGKYYQVGLGKTLTSVAEIQDGAEDALQRAIDSAKNTGLRSGYGIDFGMLWTAQNFRFGAWAKNINSPSFKFDPVGKDCESVTSSVEDQNACYVAKSFADEIDLEETYIMDAQVSVEAALYSDSRNFVASFSADTSPVNDPVGNQLQWVNASVGYATTSWIIPGIRAGYRKNLAGTQLSAVTGGLTVFKMFHIDGAYGLETIDVDGTPTPRMAQLNIGVNLLF